MIISSSKHQHHLHEQYLDTRGSKFMSSGQEVVQWEHGDGGGVVELWRGRGQVGLGLVCVE